MSEKKWTPGPWRVLEGKYGLQVHSEKHWLVNLKCESCPVHEEANAHLIAAAPELYEALAMARWHMEVNNCNLPRTFEVIDAALAKARGESK